MTAMTDPVFTASVDYATRPMSDSERRAAILRFAEVYIDLPPESVEGAFYAGYVRAVSHLAPEESTPLFYELVAAVREVKEWDEDPNAYGVNHGLKREEWLETGKRLASEQEALLSRLCGGVA